MRTGWSRFKQVLDRPFAQTSSHHYPCKSHGETVFKETEVVLICRMHEHSLKKKIMQCSSHKNSIKEQVFPELLETNSELFSFVDCEFGMRKSNESTERMVIYKEFGIVKTYNIESFFQWSGNLEVLRLPFQHDAYAGDRERFL